MNTWTQKLCDTQPNLSYRERDGAQRGCWMLSFSYGDWAYVVCIPNHYAQNEIEYTLEVWIDGDKYRSETVEQRKQRHEDIVSHGGDVTADDSWHLIPNIHEKGVMKLVENCLFRWQAIRMLVNPATTY